MTLARWKRLSSTLVRENPWWRYRLDTFALPSGATGEYHYVSTHGSVMIVPIDADGRLVMVEQFRFLGGKDSMEFPAGSIDAGEAPEEAASRELAEEAGVAGTLTPIGTFCPWNGVTDELCHVFVATGLEALPHPPEKDATEELVVHRVARGELDAQIRAGVQWDGMTLAAYAMATPYFVP